MGTYMFHAACRHKNPIFGPTPGREHRSSILSGTSELKLARNIRAVRFKYLFFRLTLSGIQPDKYVLGFPAPEANLVDTLRDGIVICGQHGIQTQLSAESDTEILDGSIRSLILRLGG